MAIAVDQTSIGEFASDTAGATVAFTTTQAVAANGFIVVPISFLQSGTETVTGVSGGGLSWSIDKQARGGSASGCAIASAQAPGGLAAGTVITAAFNVSVGGARSICGISFTGVATSSPVDGTPDAKSQTAGTAWTTDSVTIQNGSLLIAIAMNTTNLFTSTPTAPSIEAHDFGSGGFSTTVCYRIEATGGSFTVAGTWSSTANAEVVAVAYLVNATPPAPSTPAFQ